MYHEIKSKKDIEKLVDYLSNCNLPIDVYSERKVKKRTNPQNKFLHGILLRSLANYLGWNLLEMKGMMAIRYATVNELPIDTDTEYLDHLSNIYHLYVYKNTIYVTEKTSSMNIQRKMRYMDDIIEYADKEFGLKFSPPTEDYFDEYELKLIKS